tara:strand:- start:280 stop:549 length:270 start_codon:yes stop_codon:yes gene_type:complete
MSEKLYEYKTINSRGATHHLIRMQGEENWKHHMWDGPAIIPHTKSSEFKKSYFLNGTEYNSEEYNELMQEREGLPWYKSSAPKGETYRN